MRSVVLAIVCSLSAPVIAADGADADFSVKANGVRVITAEADEAARAFNLNPGLTVSLLVSAPKGGIIHFDPASSAISKFLDEKGNDLLAKPAKADEQKSPLQSGFNSSAKIGKEGKSCIVEVEVPNLPAKGSTHLTLEGIMTLLTATQTREDTINGVALAADAKLKADKLELTVAHVGKPDWGPDTLELTLRTSNDMDEVAAIRFYKADGAEIKSTRATMTRMELYGSRTIEWTYTLSEKVNNATVKIFIWSDLQRKKVQFSLDVNLGL